jgi:hypothetical protein
MKKYLSPAFWGLCFIIFTLLVKLVDVQAAGAEASLIGFAGLNTAVFQLLGTNHFAYLATQLFVISLGLLLYCFNHLKNKRSLFTSFPVI